MSSTEDAFENNGGVFGKDPISVVIVDDHEIINMGLQLLISMTDDITVIGTANDGRKAVEVVLAERPDVVLMDIYLPGMDGVQATAEIIKQRPETKVVMLTSSADSADINRALGGGARGYVLKHSDPAVILDAIRAVAAGGAPLDPIAASVLLQRQPVPSAAKLSGRELEVLMLLAEGLANKQIAARLGITERTVKAHLTKIYSQIDVTDRTHAALWASKNGVAKKASY
jgi:DNA-binding NarL/FixJ family response regulator